VLLHRIPGNRRPVLAAADKKNDAVPNGLRPLTLFLALLGVGAAFGMQTCKFIHCDRNPIDFSLHLLSLHL